MFRRLSAEMLNQQALAKKAKGDLEGAIELFRRAAARAPKWSAVALKCLCTITLATWPGDGLAPVVYSICSVILSQRLDVTGAKPNAANLSRIRQGRPAAH